MTNPILDRLKLMQEQAGISGLPEQETTSQPPVLSDQETTQPLDLSGLEPVDTESTGASLDLLGLEEVKEETEVSSKPDKILGYEDIDYIKSLSFEDIVKLASPGSKIDPKLQVDLASALAGSTSVGGVGEVLVGNQPELDTLGFSGMLKAGLAATPLGVFVDDPLTNPNNMERTKRINELESILEDKYKDFIKSNPDKEKSLLSRMYSSFMKGNPIADTVEGATPVPTVGRTQSAAAAEGATLNLADEITSLFGIDSDIQGEKEQGYGRGDPAMLASEIVGSVIAPGLGAAKLASKGATASSNLGARLIEKTGSNVLGKTASVTGKLASYAAPGAILSGIAAAGDQKDISETALLGAVTGASLPVIGGVTSKVGKPVINWLSKLAPTTKNAVLKVAKTIADQSERPIDEVLEVFSKESDTILAFEKLGLDPEQAAVAISNSAVKAFPGTANELANVAGKSLVETRGKASDEISDYLSSIDTNISGKATGEAIRSFGAETDAIFKQFANMTFGPKRNTTAAILKDKIALQVNDNVDTMLKNSGIQRIEPKDIYIGDDGVPLIASVESKPITESAFKKLSKSQQKDVIKINGKLYMRDDLFELSQVDGRILQMVDQDLSTKAAMMGGAETAEGKLYSTTQKELSESQKMADPNLAEVKAIDSANRGQSSVMNAFESIAARIPSGEDFVTLQNVINKELLSTGRAPELTKEAILGAINNLTSQGKVVRGMINPDGSFNETYRKFMLANGFSAKDLDLISTNAKRLTYLNSLSQKPSMSQIDDNLIEKASGDITQRLFFNTPTTAVRNGLIHTILRMGRNTPVIKQILDTYGVKQADVIKQIASLDEDKMKKIIAIIDKSKKGSSTSFIKELMPIIYGGTVVTNTE